MYSYLLSFNELIVYILLLIGMFFSFRLKKLTLSGSLTGGLIGLLIFLGAGYLGLFMLSFFFISGTLVTSYQAQIKNITKTHMYESRRTAGQVLANGGCAGLLGLISFIDNENSHLYITMMAASLASATSDTYSSELGMVHGRIFYNCLTFKPDLKGENGVVSLEGILFGIIGAALIALIYYLFLGNYSHVLWIIIAGILGNFSDSVLGATLERKHYINNNVVNFASTAIAASVMFIVLIW